MSPAPDLERRVGKFIRREGSLDEPHFMALQTFHLDAALDLSLMALLRSRRTGVFPHPVENAGLDEWSDRLALGPVGELIAASALACRPSRIVELDPGRGPLFEHLKGLRRAGELPPVSFAASGPSSLRDAFEIVHGADDEPFEYIDGDVFRPVDGDLLVWNHNQSVRLDDSAFADLPGFLTAPAVVSARCAVASAPVEVETVGGRRLRLPSRDQTIDRLAAADPSWRFRWIDGFDDGFFVPGRPVTGLLLAFADGSVRERDGYRPSL